MPAGATRPKRGRPCSASRSTRVGVRRVIAQCFAVNEASWRLMERLGMRREQLSLKAELHRSLGWVDAMTYALLREEWAAAR